MSEKRLDWIREIRGFVPVSGEWFALRCVSSKPARWYLDRVLFWAWTLEQGAFREPVIAVTPDWLKPDPEMRAVWGVWFVHGDDPSPSGKTWREVYHDAHADDPKPGEKDVTAQLPEEMPF
jgi:hypothetical protein